MLLKVLCFLEDDVLARWLKRLGDKAAICASSELMLNVWMCQRYGHSRCQKESGDAALAAPGILLKPVSSGKSNNQEVLNRSLANLCRAK